MRFAIVQLYTQGAKLSKEAIAGLPPLIGDLEISDWREGNVAKRILRKAELYEVKSGWRKPMLTPLFDPAFVRMTERWFVLRGFEFYPPRGACHSGNVCRNGW